MTVIGQLPTAPSVKLANEEGKMPAAMGSHLKSQPRMWILRIPGVDESNRLGILDHIVRESECLQTGDYESAYQASKGIEQAIARPGSAQVALFNNRGVICTRLNKLDEANRCFVCALSLAEDFFDPIVTPRHMVKISLNLGLLHAFQGDTARALRAFAWSDRYAWKYAQPADAEVAIACSDLFLDWPTAAAVVEDDPRAVAAACLAEAQKRLKLSGQIDRTLLAQLKVKQGLFAYCSGDIENSKLCFADAWREYTSLGTAVPALLSDAIQRLVQNKSIDVASLKGLMHSLVLVGTELKEHVVFIAYRHAASSHEADTLFESFAAKQLSPYMDLRDVSKPTIRHTIQKVKSCQNLVLLLGRETCYRFRMPDDILRQELEAAYSAGINVITVAQPDFKWEDVSTLPDSLLWLKEITLIKYDREYYSEMLRKVAVRLVYNP